MTKATVTDTPTNTALGYLFVKQFAWSSAGDNENHVGHPKPGRVYRSVFNKDTKTWRLFYEIDGKLTGIFLPKLNAEERTDEDKFFTELQYTAEIIELSKTTILDCDITTEDLDLLCKWIDEGNQPIKHIMGFEREQPHGFMPVSGEEIVRALQQNMLRDEEFVAFIKQARHLKENNLLLFDAIAEFVWFLNESMAVPDETIDSTWTEFSKTLGAGKNISKSLEHLSRYGGESQRTNMMQEDLFGAIKSLMLEQARRSLHGIHE